MSSKRKARTTSGQEKQTKKKQRKSKSDDVHSSDWPDYFHSLFKVYKALNTVLAFVTSRKQLATSFHTIRSSVENITKEYAIRPNWSTPYLILLRPLDLNKVAELKYENYDTRHTQLNLRFRALLPDVIQFAYVPSSSIRVNDPSTSRSNEPDFSEHSERLKRAMSSLDEEEHVLTLEFAETWGSVNSGNIEQSSLAPTRTPAATKKLIERRNERYVKAVTELAYDPCRKIDEVFDQAFLLHRLLSATASPDDPVALLLTAARDHIPVHPGKKANPSCSLILEDPLNTAIPDPENRPSVNEVLNEITNQTWYKDQIIEHKSIESREGKTAEIELSRNIQQALRDSRGISSLYSHQVSSIKALSSGRHVIVSTSTASGKTVIYQVPLLRFLEENPSSTAIFVYPTKVSLSFLDSEKTRNDVTKALAQDQKASLERLLSACPGLEHIEVATYDGDTPTEKRRGIRETASVIFTNFDMLNASVLPHEELWRRFLKSLKLFVVDELHYYSGTMGSIDHETVPSHMCRAWNATIANPKSHMENIFGIPPDEVEAVTEDGSPAGSKEFVIWSSPYVDELDTAMGKASTLHEATGLMRFLMKRGLRVILFCKFRKVCELVMKTLRTELSAEGRHDILERVHAYRGGYSPEDRRKIEHDAFTGQLLGIVATNALELGVDIGVLDAVIMLGFPITLASFKQQAGRAGRRQKDSLVIFVAQALPVDRYYVENPGDLFDGQTDDLVIDLHSEEILESHLQCAAHEMPISLEDAPYFGPLMKGICETKLVKDKDNWYHTNPKFLPSPSQLIAIRGAREVRYVLVDITRSDKKILEEIEISRALFEVYEGGVFLHQGKTFIVKDIQHDSKLVSLVQADVNWTTTPRDFKDVNACQTYRIREIQGSPHRASYGSKKNPSIASLSADPLSEIEIRCQVFGFYKMRNTVILDVVDLENDPWEQETTGLWIDVPNHVLPLLRDKYIKPAAAIHSAAHAFLNQFALAQDLRTECKAEEKEYLKKESQRKRPARIVVYDQVGHAGISAKAFDNASKILHKARAAIERCGCTAGCTKCVLSPSCKEGNKVYSKAGALAVLKGILDLYIDPDSIPYETDERALGGHDSIENAYPVHSRANVPIEVDATTI
ncbi:ATP-dependent 3'-5' DNA helicase [Marasmius tenuissimus]|uniref:ATP-dependent 3'-5' DNA helicase n=1 Tax=Marasmius tenuissimus TaxID=585030 RepID=A0ABR3ACH5_9AGAR